MAKRQTNPDNYLKVASLNLSIEAVKRRPQLLEAQVKQLMSEVDVLLIQEAGAAKVFLDKIVNFFNDDDDYSENTNNLLKRVALDLDVELYAGEGKIGQASDPILFSKDLDLLYKKSYFLTPKLWQGYKGAGARPWSKPKFMNTITFRYRGRKITAGDIHVTPSQYLHLRYRIAKKQTTAAAKALEGMRGLRLVGGDWNAVPGKSVLDPIVQAGLVSAQKFLGMKPTHGSRPIDDIYFLDDPNRWVLISLESRDTTSDHNAVIVTVEVIPSKKYLARRP
jgi:hypothetical protein